MGNKDKSLPQKTLQIIRQKATEAPHSGKYISTMNSGTYICRSCGQALFRSQSKFNASCGWPSFDAAIALKVLEVPDADGLRQEIVCAQCDAHLGHVFDGEGYTPTNRRFCVNSLSLDFIEDSQISQTEEAIVAGGCFWGVQYFLQRLPGVVKTEVGYIGGHTVAPSYQEVCQGLSGHYEAVRVLFDPQHLNYENLIKYFFEIHDPFQQDGQGPDKGQQYLSVIFYYDEHQKKIAQLLINTLQQQKPVATKLLPVSVFWPAEIEHQDYYEKTGHKPYCHVYLKRFK